MLKMCRIYYTETAVYDYCIILILDSRVIYQVNILSWRHFALKFKAAHVCRALQRAGGR